MVSRAQTITVAIVGDTSKLSSSLSDGQRRVQNFGIAATAALVAFGAASVKAYAERSMAQDKLNFALAKSPALMNLNAEALAGYNTELASKVAIDDDVIAGAEAVLARFAQNEDQLKNLTELSADYARVTGTDITTAAGTVGKALLGNTRALKALGISYTATGNAAKDAAAIQQLLNDKIGGFAEQFAGTAQGKLEELNRQFGELQETVGQALLPALETLMDVTKPVLEAYGNLPKPVQQTAFAVALLGSVAMAAGPRILVMKKALDESNVTMATTQARAKGAAVALGKGGLVAAMFAAVAAGAYLGDKLSGNNEGLQKVIDTSDAVDISFHKLSLTTDMLVNLQTDVFGAVNRASLGLFHLDTAASVAEEKLAALDEQLAGMVSSGNADKAAKEWARLVKYAEDQGVSLDDLQAKFPQYEAALNEAGGAAAEAADKTARLTDKVQGLIDKFTVLKQGYLDQRAATNAYESALNDADKALRENGRTLDKHTDAGIANRTALDAIATAGNDVITSMIKQGASTQQTMSRYREMRGELIDQAKQFGDTQKEAESYASQILKTPGSVRTHLEAITDKQEVIDFQHMLDNLDGKQIYTYIGTIISSAVQSGAGTKHRAGGGRIDGVGGPRSDSNLILASRGEYVINAESANRIGYANLDMLNRFAGGGRVAEDGSHVGSGFYAGMSDKEKAAAQAQQQAQQDDWKELLGRMHELVQTARAHLNELKGQRRDMAAGIQSGLMGNISLSGTLAENRDNDAQSRLRRFRQTANHIIRFMKQLNRLRKAGLHGALYNEVRDLGADEGYIVARQLLADPGTIDGFMNVQHRLDRQTQQFANRAASRRFGDSIDAARNRLNASDRALDRAREARQNGATIHELHLHLDKNTTAKDRREVKRMAHMLMEEIEKINRHNGHANRKNGRKGNG